MNFKSGNWNKEVNVRDFIQRNYTPYDGGKEFLAAPTERTKALWNQLLELMKVERERKGVYDIDEKTISTITAHDAGYINKDLEQIVGLQTDAPLKRAIMPFGGIRLIHTQLEAYGRQMDPIVDHVFKYRKTHNDGVFDVYTDEMKRARHAGIMTGLPDAYGRGRIIGDYRRVALYGVDFLIVQKQAAKKNMVIDVMDSDHIRKREEIAEQIKALAELKEMAAKYGFDISRPAENTKEAIQWLYFAYLATLDYCEEHGKPVWIRHVMVPGLTLTRDRLTALAAYLKPFKCIQRIDLLPFHKMAEYKWEQLHIRNTLLDTPEPTKEEIRMAEEIFFPEKFGKS